MTTPCRCATCGARGSPALHAQGCMPSEQRPSAYNTSSRRSLKVVALQSTAASSSHPISTDILFAVKMYQVGNMYVIAAVAVVGGKSHHLELPS